MTARRLIATVSRVMWLVALHHPPGPSVVVAALQQARWAAATRVADDTHIFSSVDVFQLSAGFLGLFLL